MGQRKATRMQRPAWGDSNPKFAIRNSKWWSVPASWFPSVPAEGIANYQSLTPIIPHSAINVSPLPITTAAININDTRGLRAAELAREALEAMGRPVARAPVLLCGASYREDVGDTRYSGSEIIARRLAELGAEIRVHDPYVDHWHELEHQDAYPATGQSRSRFFKNQDALGKVRVDKDLASALRGASAIILAVRHNQYLDLDPDWLVGQAGAPLAIVDCFGILSDESIRSCLKLGCEVRCLGRGHVARLKDNL
jgi:UDP-N-acetyl-D-mannosaminuronate dehydrogenase